MKKEILVLFICCQSLFAQTKIDIEKLVNSKDLNSSIIELDNYISDLCQYGEHMEKLNQAQKIFYYNQSLEREINNGGFNQYFLNSSGDYSHETVLALKAIGANKTSGILQQAIDQFPNKKVPSDRNARQDLLIKIEKSANPVWQALDLQFYKYDEDLNLLNIEFIKNNKESFSR